MRKPAAVSFPGGIMDGVGMLVAAALAGVTVPLQAGLNSVLGRALGYQPWATLVSLLVSLAVTVPALLLVRAPLPALDAAASAPGWSWLGGILGAGFLTAGLLLAPRLGAAGFLTAVVAGQMAASLLLDHFGLAGFPVRPVTLARIGGVALVFAGVMVIQMSARR
jgi:transporter family-2 protein